MPHQFADYARQSPNHLALVAPDGRHWSRGELQLECDRLKGGLHQAGLAPGNCVTLALPNCAEFVALALAITGIGCEVEDHETRCAAGGADEAPRRQKPRLLIGHQRLADTASALRAALDLDPMQIFAVGVIEGFRGYDDLLLADATPHSDGANDSGSPALPPALSGIETERDEVHYCGLSLADDAVRTGALDALNHGHAVILSGQWNPQKMLHDIERYRVTSAQMAPAQFGQLLELPGEVRSARDMSSIRHVVSRVEPCPETLKQAMMLWWDLSVIENTGAILSPEHESPGELSHGNARR